MAQSAIQQIKPPVQRFVFTEANTIGDLFEKVNELEKAGKPPFLKFLGTRGQIIAAEVLVEDHETETIELTQAGRSALEESGEMAAISGDEDEQPDPAGLRLRQMMHDVRWGGVKSNTPVLFQGERTTWGHLSQDEKMLCTFDSEGGLVGEYRF